MPRRYAVALAVLFVALNAGAYLYLRYRMAEPPDPAQPRSMASSLPAATETSDALGLAGPVLLSGAPDGSVLRATRGNCAEQTAATVWVAPGDAGPAVVEVPGLVETLAVGRTQRNGWLIVGADDRCEVSAWSTPSYTDVDWRAMGVPADAWYLDAEAATRVRSPRGPVALPEACVARWVQTVGTYVYVVCDDGRAMRADRTARTFQPVLTGVAAMTVGADGRQAYLVESPSCAAQLRVFDRTQAEGDEHCFGFDKAPLGIAWTGRDLVAQIGFDLVGNATGSWEVRG